MDHAVYRIIDANFNRAREALRVMEEFCRFALNCSALTARCKQLRHELSAEIDKLDAGKLIAGRDTLADVGVGSTVENQLRRKSLSDCFIAASKRLSEALRALAEMTQTIDPAIAAQIEQLRYAAYTLEKDIQIFSDTAEKYRKVRLYVIITSDLPADVLFLAQNCIKGGADCIQLRTKNIHDDQLFALASQFTQICSQGGVISIINDRADIAIAAGADGVHVGQTDLPVEQIRKLQLSPLIVGLSTHSPQQLHQALKQNITYAALGPVFSTPTKPKIETVGLDYIKNSIETLEDTGIGHVVIGGINLDNIDQVLNVGAKTIAVCSAVTKAKEPAKACAQLKQKIDACH